MSMSKRTGIAKRTGIVVIVGMVLFGALHLAEQLSIPGASRVTSSVISSADAVVGRPLTPVSVAGVARRTSRRR